MTRFNKGIKTMKLMTLLSCLLVLMVAPTWACRYNVRDVGFVDFDAKPYHLNFYYNQQTPSHYIDVFKQVSFAAALDSNIQVSLIDVQQQSDDPALNYIQTGQNLSKPVMVLVSPEGDALSIESPTDNQELMDSLWKTFEDLNTSNLRERIVAESIKRFGVVLVVDGTDPAENQKTHQLAKKVVEHVERNMSNLPKVINHPPVMIMVDQQVAQRERVLLWSLGLDPKSLTSSAVAVLYGRGRRIGDLMQGANLDEDTLYNTLSVIGLSCECGLDRTWMMGLMFPFQWNESHRDEAAKHLGFDPENPMVKIEISQIMTLAGTNKRIGLNEAASYVDPLLGYNEMVVITNVPVGEVDEVAVPTPDLGLLVAENLVSATTDDPARDVQESSVETTREWTSNFSFVALKSSMSLSVMVLGGLAIFIVLVAMYVLMRRDS